jgi:formylmethanofuran dehydrogenase subunit D
VIVKAQIKEQQPEGIVVMPPSPWAFAVVETMVPSQGIDVIIKPSKGPITPSTNLP